MTAALGPRLWALAESAEGARLHGVDALLDRLAPPDIPETAQAAFESAFRRILAENMSYLKVTGDVLALLGKADIPAMPLKGVLFASRFYPHLGARPQSDVDVLVKPESLSRAHDLLLSAGWAEGRPRGFYRDHYHWIYWKKGAGLLELHWALKPPGTSSPDLRRIWARAEETKAEGLSYLQMSGEDLLSYLAVNKAAQHFGALLFFVDLHQIIERSRIDWERLLKNARDDKISGALWFGLRHCRELLGAPVPAEALRELSRRSQATGARCLDCLLRFWGGPLHVPPELLEGPLGRLYEAFLEWRPSAVWSLLAPLVLPSRARVEALSGGSYLRYLRQQLLQLGRQLSLAASGKRT